MERALAHFGEEPPITGEKGAGTIFFTSCNLKCPYCQNYQLSHEGRGKTINEATLAQIMLSLEKEGCHNIEAVTPTPQVAMIMAALLLARSYGLSVPFIYNTGGYESVDTLKLLDGFVDIYLPDFKYGSAQEGCALGGIRDYPYRVVFAIKEMVRQQGDGLLIEKGLARKGVLIRHLVLPGKTEDSKKVLRLIKKHISTEVPLSIMAQYTPIPAVLTHPTLGRRITKEEYLSVIDYALALNFKNIFVQEVNERHLVPDFASAQPFRW